MLDKVTRQDFEPLIGQTFTLKASEGQTFDFSLVDVVALPPPRARGRRPMPENLRREPFSLFFQAKPFLPQAIYEVQNEAFGQDALAIFLVPVGEVKDGDGGYEYEAVFT